MLAILTKRLAILTQQMPSKLCLNCNEFVKILLGQAREPNLQLSHSQPVLSKRAPPLLLLSSPSAISRVKEYQADQLTFLFMTVTLSVFSLSSLFNRRYVRP